MITNIIILIIFDYKNSVFMSYIYSNIFEVILKIIAMIICKNQIYSPDVPSILQLLHIHIESIYITYCNCNNCNLIKYPQFVYVYIFIFIQFASMHDYIMY